VGEGRERNRTFFGEFGGPKCLPNDSFNSHQVSNDYLLCFQFVLEAPNKFSISAHFFPYVLATKSSYCKLYSSQKRED
jgi:hypothetical protein